MNLSLSRASDGYRLGNYRIAKEIDSSGPVHLRDNRSPWKVYMGARQVREFASFATARAFVLSAVCS